MALSLLGWIGSFFDVAIGISPRSAGVYRPVVGRSGGSSGWAKRELIWPRCGGEGEEEGEEERKVKSMAGPHFMPRFGR